MDTAPLSKALPAPRRSILKGSLLACSAAAIAYGNRSALASSPARPSDWPAWAPSRAEHLAKVERLRKEAVNVRAFGARLDGIIDDTPALRRAYASGAKAILIDGPLRLTGPLEINRPFALLGSGDGPHLIWDGGNQRAILNARPADKDDPHAFVRDVVVSGISAHVAATASSSPLLLQAINVRGLLLMHCTTLGMGLAFVTHHRLFTGAYQRKTGRTDVDPAVVAGFSPDTLDDLNEDIYCLDNHVDNKKYQSSVLRFAMARRVMVAGNLGRFAKVSWWGGGAKSTEGGQPQFLRRVRDVYIADNTLSGSNGNIYGNNGQNVIVARNTVSDATDTAIDFEGCMDCQAYDNTVRNACNFAISTFYVARNIVFERNYVEQDGSATTLNKRLGIKSLGSARAIALVALRSAGFAGSDAITVRFANNRFVYSAPEGIGICLPSYFDTIEFVDNTLVNVSADWRFSFNRKLVISGNRFSFDRPSKTPAALLAGSAREGTIENNTLTVNADMPPGSVAIGYETWPLIDAITIRGNTVKGSGARGLPIALADPYETRELGWTGIRGGPPERVAQKIAISGNGSAQVAANARIAPFLEASDTAISAVKGLELHDYPVRKARK